MRVLVIGAGLLGVTTAYFLARLGSRVTVLEAAPGVALATSYANAALLTRSHAMPLNEPRLLWHAIGTLGAPEAALRIRPRGIPSLLRWAPGLLRNTRSARRWSGFQANLRLAEYTTEVMDEIDAMEGLDYHRTSKGTLTVYWEGQHLESGHALWDRARLRYEVLSAKEVIAIEPALTAVQGRLGGAIYHPDDAHGDPYLFCRQLTDRAIALGAEFQFDAQADALIAANGRMVGVDANGTRILADAYVLAAGSASSALARAAGVSLPMIPIKGYSLTFASSDPAALPTIPVLDARSKVALTRLGANLRIAGTAEFAGADTSFDPARGKHLKGVLDRLFPHAAATLDLGASHPWAGLRPTSIDGVPYIGSSPVSNLYLNTGHGHLGWTLAAGSARALADIIRGVAPALDMSPYRLGR